MRSVNNDDSVAVQPYAHTEVRDNGLSGMGGVHPHVVFRDKTVYHTEYQSNLDGEVYLVALHGNKVYQLTGNYNLT